MRASSSRQRVEALREECDDSCDYLFGLAVDFFVAGFFAAGLAASAFASIAFAAAALVAAARLAPEIAAFFFAFFTTIAVVVPVGLAFAAAAFLASRDLRRAAAFL